MKGVKEGLIIGISIGVVIGVVLAGLALFCVRYRRRRSQIGNSSSRRAATIPIRTNGADSCTILSDSTTGQDSPRRSEVSNGLSLWIDGPKRRNISSVSGIPKYSYKYVDIFPYYAYDLCKILYLCSMALLPVPCFENDGFVKAPAYAFSTSGFCISLLKRKTQETPSPPPQTLVPVKEEDEEKAGTTAAVVMIYRDGEEGGREAVEEGGGDVRAVEPGVDGGAAVVDEEEVFDHRGLEVGGLHGGDAVLHHYGRRSSWRRRTSASIHPQRDPFGSESRGGLHWVSEGRVFEDGGAVRLRAAVGGVGEEWADKNAGDVVLLMVLGSQVGLLNRKKNVLLLALDLQKATYNFTTLIGQGAFGPVYKAQMSTGETVAVKVLATDSRQGEKEFHTEVLLLGRLHHRNLVNLVGYCSEKGQRMLVYVYMSNGSLASHLYGEKNRTVSWDLRVVIALDVARGLEYLHDGAVPPVVHRDVKSSNILLDQSMRARVADFGLSREEVVDQHGSNVRGTFGYLDPEYISTRAFTKKSDVYSFGVLLFELIAGRNPQQGLMEYVELGAMNAEGKGGWEEIVDSRLEGKFNVKELNEIASLGYKCINSVSRKRPSMRDIVQVLSRIVKLRHSRKHHNQSVSSAEDVAIDVDGQSDSQIAISDLHREDSVDSIPDTPQV
ncbi:hypothetical protein Sjap_003389 [Stephania japonica]|uniref:Protein kinase domain-containing protein n=1 Tax=Stephania japonica TaxID=461633 RepID=A0AAP0KR29_9MAGN